MAMEIKTYGKVESLALAVLGEAAWIMYLGGWNKWTSMSMSAQWDEFGPYLTQYGITIFVGAFLLCFGMRKLLMKVGLLYVWEEKYVKKVFPLGIKLDNLIEKQQVKISPINNAK